MAIYQHDEVMDTAGATATATTRSRRFSPGQLLGGAAGIVLAVIGILAVTRAGIDSSLNTPVTHVAGMVQSAMIGLIELGAGLLLILSAADLAFRGLMAGIGALLVVAGIVVAAGTGEILVRIGSDHATGWFAAVMGGIAIVGASIPTFVRSERSTHVHA